MPRVTRLKRTLLARQLAAGAALAVPPKLFYGEGEARQRTQQKPMSWIRRNALIGFYVTAFALQIGAVWLEATGHSHPLLTRARVYFPALVAVAFFFIADGRAGLVKLAKSLMHFKVPLRWWLFALFWAPTMSIAPVFLFKVLGVRDHIEIDTGVFRDDKAFWFFKFVLTISVVEEISWVSFGIDKVRERLAPFVACMLGGALWGLWYVPLNEAGIQVAGSFPNLPMVINFMAIGCVTWWVYDRTHSAILVAFMQVMTNYAALTFPVLPKAGQEIIYFVFVGIKCAVAVFLFWKFGPHPLFGRAPAAPAAELPRAAPYPD
jgi:hypothetical protein